MKRLNPNQHCTSKKCSFTFSHTGQWCGYEQKKRCKCPFCYPKEETSPSGKAQA